jgi:hypothetical protein
MPFNQRTRQTLKRHSVNFAVESNKRKALAVPKWSRGVVTSGLTSLEVQIHFAKKGLNSRVAAARNSLKLVS